MRPPQRERRKKSFSSICKPRVSVSTKSWEYARPTTFSSTSSSDSASASKLIPMRFDVIVVGAGHAGAEAAFAAARLGCDVAICTLSRDTVAHMPCNPAVGGTAKGHLVREIDALGGLMGEAIDATGIQFKLLNRSRGPAVWSPRAQADKRLYSKWMRARLEREPDLAWVFEPVVALGVDGDR